MDVRLYAAYGVHFPPSGYCSLNNYVVGSFILLLRRVNADFKQLWGQLGVTLEASFTTDNGGQWLENERWTPKVAHRRRACVLHIMSPCVRPNRVHKQNIHISQCFLLVQDELKDAKSTKE